jgi:hypothetical protein
LTENLTEDNAVDIMAASYEINQKVLFHAASKFLFKLRLAGKTFETKAWDELKTKNPTIALKMMDEAMFHF